MGETAFWDNPDAARSVVAEMQVIKAVTEPIETLFRGIDDARALMELAQEAGDQESMEEADRMLVDLEKKGEKVELQTLLDGANDHRNCFFTIQSGQGGTEAQDWAEMLLRMYLYFFENRGWDVSEIDRQYGEQAGIKSVTLHVKGEYAFGYLRAEAGVHRLVRPSPFNAQGKRQTSFASVNVVPEFEDAGAFTIPEGDLDIVAFVRASGPGGQNVNKVATAVRITHKPSGLTVTCSVERSQQQNRSLAIGILQSKLEALEQAKRDEEMRAIVGDPKSVGFGSQIRSYVLDDRRVKDHRNGHEVFQPDRILDGDLQEFIDAQLRFKATKGAKT
jgi:peptide chain release factor 2